MYKYTFLIFFSFTTVCSAQQKAGAHIPWTTYEAENMNTNGTVLGPTYTPFKVETESSGQRCVKLSSKNGYVEFAATIVANSIVIRYSLPDKKQGSGTHATLGIYKNSKLVQQLKISSQYSMLYGKYPFTNNPESEKPRNFYDEVRIKDIHIARADTIRIELNNGDEDDAEYAIIDLADLENIAAPLNPPANSLSIADKKFGAGDADGDYTNAFRKCIATAVATGKSVWIPRGIFKITGDIILPSNIKIQGAGMWYSTFVGDEVLYTDANKRVRLKGNGSNIHLADFAVMGKLNYRNDNEPNDGIVGFYGTNSTISKLWIEHTKVGMWIENSKGLLVEGCRMRNTIADGINFCVGMAQSTIKNCTTRGTGDDCFAMWPATFIKQQYSPGENLISHCMAQLPFLANGAAIYGGKSNKVKDCSFIDISPGSAILISTTFPTEDSAKNINNNFSGTTVIENCEIRNSGGFDHEWGWRAAVQICLDKRSISGIKMNNINIGNSLSDGFSIIAKNAEGKTVVLSNAVVENIKIWDYGIGVKDKHGLWISNDAHGSLTLTKPAIAEIKNESKNFVIH